MVYVCVCARVCVCTCVLVVKRLFKMSLPVNSDYLSLERIARYRHACSNGSPFATNKPIDIKPRGRKGYVRLLGLKLYTRGWRESRSMPAM